VSLLFLPTIYAILDDMRSSVSRLVRKARGAEPTPAAATVAAISAQ
jgi:HAE1 family hydrophobic/amphiphilic exporter-1